MKVKLRCSQARNFRVCGKSRSYLTLLRAQHYTAVVEVSSDGACYGLLIYARS